MHDILIFAQKHAALSLALIIIIVLLMILEFVRSKSAARTVTASRATLMINHQNAVVVDIRSADLFKSGHIVDAISLPLSDIEKHYTKLDVYKTKPIILCSATGVESDQAVTLLSKHQFTDVSILQNGIRGWKEAGMPLVKG